MPIERLQKILSRAGISSRRRAEALILDGQVAVDGKIVRELGTKADPAVNRITVGGKALAASESFSYYAYYKPRGVIVSKRDDWGNATVFSVLKLPPAVNAVGRLDKDSEGLLLLTDDGDFLMRYTHPSFDVSKVYHVWLTRPLEAGELQRLRTGVPLEEKIVRAARVRAWKEGPEPWLEIELKEGLKREIRRMLAFVGVKVKRLIRVRHGSVELGDMRPGKLKALPKRPH